MLGGVLGRRRTAHSASCLARSSLRVYSRIHGDSDQSQPPFTLGHPTGTDKVVSRATKLEMAGELAVGGLALSRPCPPQEA